jgi:hypothetical protein
MKKKVQKTKKVQDTRWQKYCGGDESRGVSANVTAREHGKFAMLER